MSLALVCLGSTLCSPRKVSSPALYSARLLLLVSHSLVEQSPHRDQD